MYDINNIFSKILKGETPCSAIYENDHVLAFKDINPKAKIHVLIIPKGKYLDMEDFLTNASEIEIVEYFKSFHKVALLAGLAGEYRVVSNCGKRVGQEVFHFHSHMLGGEPLKGF